MIAGQLYADPKDVSQEHRASMLPPEISMSEILFWHSCVETIRKKTRRPKDTGLCG